MLFQLVHNHNKISFLECLGDSLQVQQHLLQVPTLNALSALVRPHSYLKLFLGTLGPSWTTAQGSNISHLHFEKSLPTLMTQFQCQPLLRVLDILAKIGLLGLQAGALGFPKRYHSSRLIIQHLPIQASQIYLKFRHFLAFFPKP